MEQVVTHNEKKKSIAWGRLFRKKRRDFDVGKHCALRGIGLSPRSSWELRSAGLVAASSGSFLQTFRDNLWVPSSGFKNPLGFLNPEGSLKLQNGADRLSRNVGNNHYLLRNNPKQRSSKLYEVENVAVTSLCRLSYRKEGGILNSYDWLLHRQRRNFNFTWQTMAEVKKEF